MRRHRASATKRGVIAVTLALSVVATSTVASAQPAQDWPDGEWFGFINGGGSAHGTINTRTGSFTGGGAANANGLFDLTITDGDVVGGYGITWQGSGSSNAFESVLIRIDELGTIEGTDGLPLLLRTSADGTIVVEGEELPIPARPIAPGPTPLIAESLDCQIIEGFFEGKLAGLEEAARTFGIAASSEENFTAFRFSDTSPEAKAERTATLQRLADLTSGFGSLLVAVFENGLGYTINEAEVLLTEIEEILAALDALPECDGVNTEGFSLGVSKAVERMVLGLLEYALELQDGKAIANLAALAGRAGVLPGVHDVGVAVTDKAAMLASELKDVSTLQWLLIAAFTFGDIDLFHWIEGEIAAIGTGS